MKIKIKYITTPLSRGIDYMRDEIVKFYYGSNISLNFNGEFYEVSNSKGTLETIVVENKGRYVFGKL